MNSELKSVQVALLMVSESVHTAILDCKSSLLSSSEVIQSIRRELDRIYSDLESRASSNTVDTLRREFEKITDQLQELEKLHSNETTALQGLVVDLEARFNKRLRETEQSVVTHLAEHKVAKEILAGTATTTQPNTICAILWSYKKPIVLWGVVVSAFGKLIVWAYKTDVLHTIKAALTAAPKP